jgi:hypothetical protein
VVRVFNDSGRNWEREETGQIKERRGDGVRRLFG